MNKFKELQALLEGFQLIREHGGVAPVYALAPLRETRDALFTEARVPLDGSRLTPRHEAFIQALVSYERAVRADERRRLGSAGGQRGGRARAAKLSPKARSDQASRAANARWERHKPKSIGKSRG